MRGTVEGDAVSSLEGEEIEKGEMRDWAEAVAMGERIQMAGVAAKELRDWAMEAVATEGREWAAVVAVARGERGLVMRGWDSAVKEEGGREVKGDRTGWWWKDDKSNQGRVITEVTVAVREILTTASCIIASSGTDVATCMHAAGIGVNACVQFGLLPSCYQY